MPFWQKKKDKKGTYNHEVRFSGHRFLMKEEGFPDMRSLKSCPSTSWTYFVAALSCCLRPAMLLLPSPERFLTIDSSKRGACMLKNKGVRHQIPHYGMPAC